MATKKKMGLRDYAAEDLMTAPVLSLDAGTSLKEAARFLLSHGYSGAPVVDDAGKAVGVLSLHDIARYAEWHLEADEIADSRKESLKPLDDDKDSDDDMDIDRLTDATVRQVMTPKVQKVAYNDSATAAVKALLKGPYHRIFVSDKQGVLIGVISTMDVLRIVAKTL